MKHLTIIGKGNVGTHLFKALTNGPLQIEFLSSVDLKKVSPETDCILLTVKDEYIKKVSESLTGLIPDFKGIVAHCAGSMELDVLSPYFEKYGVFYPLQTFSRNIEISNYSDIPVMIEGNIPEVEKGLMSLGDFFSKDVKRMNSKERKVLHLSSVFACNFVNSMYMISEEILNEAGISFDVVRPLIRQTALKVMDHSPAETQTGPAVRGDKSITESHIQMLEESSLQGKTSHAMIYNIITNYIQNKFNKKQYE